MLVVDSESPTDQTNRAIDNYRGGDSIFSELLTVYSRSPAFIWPTFRIVSGHDTLPEQFEICNDICKSTNKYTTLGLYF